MSDDDKHGIPQVRYGPIQWMSDPIRAAIETAVSDYRGHEWRIRREKDLSEFACHKCAVVSDRSFAVFFKYSEAVKAKQQFEVELSGLRTLSSEAGILIPRPISIVPVEKGTLLIMKALESIRRGTDQWRQIGTTLARIHRVKGNSFGFGTNGFCGPLFQDNTPTREWVTFFRERLLIPRLKVAIDSGNIPTDVVSKVEMLSARLPELCGPDLKPSLLHGDAQQNNFISTAEGTFVIDPAVYYGNPEIDLALIDAFQPVPGSVFDAYRDLMPINPGFLGRRDLWRVPLFLAAIAIEGSMHLNRLTDALGKYL